MSMQRRPVKLFSRAMRLSLRLDFFGWFRLLESRKMYLINSRPVVILLFYSLSPLYNAFYLYRAQSA